jgi:site-specific DNA-methyltransferase (cytosine-N4-specific)
VIAFFRDLNKSIASISQSLNPGGLMVWILGNRIVGGKRVPLDKVVAELLNNYKISLLTTIIRQIPSKRMAIKNNGANTMSAESILLMRKAH